MTWWSTVAQKLTGKTWGEVKVITLFKESVLEKTCSCPIFFGRMTEEMTKGRTCFQDTGLQKIVIHMNETAKFLLDRCLKTYVSDKYQLKHNENHFDWFLENVGK